MAVTSSIVLAMHLCVAKMTGRTLHDEVEIELVRNIMDNLRLHEQKLVIGLHLQTGWFTFYK